MPQPYIRFFGVDWRSDPRLRLCCAASRGVWIDLITLMMEADPFGYLVINGTAATEVQMAALTCTPMPVVRKALTELEVNGVFSRTQEGVIFSRRMVRDMRKSKLMVERGRRGGNPALNQAQHAEDKPEVNLKDKPEVNQHSLSPMVEATIPIPSKDSASSLRSEAAAEGGTEDPILAVFDAGIRLLTKRGMTEKQARSLIGKHRKTLHDDGKLLGIVLSVEHKSPVDLASYLEKAVKRAANGGVAPFGSPGFA